MRIAVYYNLEFGGAKKVVLEHVKGLTNRNHIVDVYTTDFENDIFDPSKKVNTVYRYPFSEASAFTGINRLVSDYKNFVTLKKLHKRIALDIDSRSYDVVIAHPDRLTQAPFLLRFLNTTSVYYCQEPLRIAYEYGYRLMEKVGFLKTTYEQLTRFHRKRIDRDNVRSATFTLASCYHIRERMIEAYDIFPKVSYLGVDQKVFRPLPISKINEIIFVGSKSRADGYDLVEKALKLLPSSLKPRLNLVAWTKENSKRLSEKDLVVNYNRSLATLCTSRLETFGLVPLESMACGTPVIATKVGGHRETVIDGKTGFLVDFDPEEIAERIKIILEKPSIVTQLGKFSRKYIEDVWNWERRIGELEVILRNFLIKHNKR